MERKLRIFMILFAAAAFCSICLPCVAQEKARGPRVSTLTIASADDLLGRGVANRQGVRLGHVGGILLHEESIAYIILYISKPDGTWQKLPVPASMAELSLSDHVVLLDVENHRLPDAPAYSGNERPDFSDLEWEQRIHSYYGENPPAHARESYILISR